MGTLPDLLPRVAAAKMLRVTVRTLSNFVRQGLIKPVIRERRVYFHHTDITTLLETMGGNMDLASVATMAMRAFVRAEQCEKKLASLLILLGVDSPPLSTSKKAVLDLYKRVRELRAKQDGSSEAGEIFYLSKELLGISEEYLRLVEHYTANNEPWRVFLEVSQHLCKLAPRNRFTHDHELTRAYGFLEAARRHVRSVAYFYVRASHGRNVADTAFVGDNAFDPVITTLFPN